MDVVLSSTVNGLIDSIVSKVVIPKLEKLATRIGLEYNKLLIPKGEHFTDYFHRCYQKYNTVNAFIFKNNQMLLKDIYIPLTLTTDEKNEKKIIKIDGYPTSFVEIYGKILIDDTAGIGKSTISKRMFLDVIDNGYGIPIFIELRRLSESKNLISEIQRQLSSLSKEFDPQLMLEFLQMGGFIFFLDGYDEISFSEKESVTRDLQDFIAKANENVYILTSRHEASLASFGGFQKTSISPLIKDEAFELLGKYDNKGSVSKCLIEKLQSVDYRMMDDFLKNPLLVSLLFAAFDYKQTIPLKKHIFYRQVYDAHFDSHDLSKGGGYIHEKKSKLDIDDFERVLRYIGFECIKQQKIEFSKDELLAIIAKAKSFCVDLKFCMSDFFDDILRSVPLFCQDGGLYRWMHKSLQEYFAAQFIFKDTKENQHLILSTIYNGNHIEKYYNMLDLYYDVDVFGFRKSILLPLLKEYKTDFGDKNLNENINILKGLLFKTKAYFLVTTDDLKTEKIDELIKEIDSQSSVSFSWSIGVEYTHIFCIHLYAADIAKKNLLTILGNKKVNFISYCDSNNENDFNRYNLEKYLALEKNKPYIFDSNIDNPIRKYSFWQEINCILIESALINGDIYIKIDDCINEITKIEEEISIRESLPTLLVGL